MKGKIALEILEVVVEKTGRMADIIEVFSKSRRAPSEIGEIAKHVRKRRTAKQRLTKEKFKGWEADLRLRERYRGILRWLERDGMIKKPMERGWKFLEVTRKGRKYLERLRSRQKVAFPTPRYDVVKSDNLVVVSFDIPEKEARKRQWLRAALKSLGFRMKQESFWIGYVKIPKAFIRDICQMKIIGHIEVFAVTRKGSLREIPVK
jgi:CRISPR-associated endonuclease Cas2